MYVASTWVLLILLNKSLATIPMDSFDACIKTRNYYMNHVEKVQADCINPHDGDVLMGYTGRR